MRQLSSVATERDALAARAELLAQEVRSSRSTARQAAAGAKGYETRAANSANGEPLRQQPPPVNEAGDSGAAAAQAPPVEAEVSRTRAAAAAAAAATSPGGENGRAAGEAKEGVFELFSGGDEVAEPPVMEFVGSTEETAGGDVGALPERPLGTRNAVDGVGEGPKPVVLEEEEPNEVRVEPGETRQRNVRGVVCSRLYGHSGSAQDLTNSTPTNTDTATAPSSNISFDAPPLSSLEGLQDRQQRRCLFFVPRTSWRRRRHRAAGGVNGSTGGGTGPGRRRAHERRICPGRVRRWQRRPPRIPRCSLRRRRRLRGFDARGIGRSYALPFPACYFRESFIHRNRQRLPGDGQQGQGWGDGGRGRRAGRGA